MLIILPWPDRRLNPNARIHWRAKAPVVKKAREGACYFAYEAMPHCIPETRGMYAGSHSIAVQVFFYPPDKRHRDDDNCIAAFKSSRDGIADALGVDDRRFRAQYTFCTPVSPGKIEIVL